MASAQSKSSLGGQTAHGLKELGCYSRKRAAGQQKQLTGDMKIKLKEERNSLKK